MASARSREVPLFPMFLRLAGRRSVVVGAGKTAEGKIASLLRAGATVTVIAPRASRRVAALAGAHRIAWRARNFRARDLRGATLVVAATSSNRVNESVRRAAANLGVLCNVVDDPPRCDFFYPAVVRRGSLQIAISTSGKSPALARQIRRALERQFDSRWTRAVNRLGSERRQLLRRELSPRHRKSAAQTMARATFNRLQTARRGNQGGKL